jgi:hypothetical protein
MARIWVGGRHGCAGVRQKPIAAGLVQRLQLVRVGIGVDPFGLENCDYRTQSRRIERLAQVRRLPSARSNKTEKMNDVDPV